MSNDPRVTTRSGSGPIAGRGMTSAISIVVSSKMEAI
jgi:hypothetical protein